MTAAPATALLAEVQHRLVASPGMESPRRVARRIVEAAAGLAPAALVLDPSSEIGAAARATALDWADRHAAGEPLSRILGKREFWSLSFRLSPATLDPRPDSETVVAAALAPIADRARPLRLLDIGTGSGCLLLALLSELPLAVGVGIDRSEDAARQARANAGHLGLGARAHFVVGSWLGGIAGPFDLIVSNPPFIRRGDLAGLSRAVREHDPMLALDGGDDGLDAYRAILAAAPACLADNGRLVLEVGHDQADAVEALASGAGLRPLARASDLAGIERVVVFAS